MGVSISSWNGVIKGVQHVRKVLTGIEADTNQEV